MASVREDPTDHQPPPARLNRSVDFELGVGGGGAGGRGTTEEVVAPPSVTATGQQTAKSSSFLSRDGNLSCRVHLLDGEEIAVQVEVKNTSTNVINLKML